MNKVKRKKRKINKLLSLSLIFILFIYFISYVNFNIAFKPFIAYDGDNRLVVLTKNWIHSKSTLPFISKQAIDKLDSGAIDQSISSVKIKRNFFLVWTIAIKKKINSRYILLNNQIRLLDDDFNLTSISFDQGNNKKQIPFLYQIDIREAVPVKKAPVVEKKEEKVDEKIKETKMLTETEIYQLYQEKIKSFIKYLSESESSLGPKISSIDFFPKEGLRILLYGNHYWFGKNKNYQQMERNISLCESYLNKKNKSQTYNEFDLRYKNRIICRNNQ